MGRLLTAGAELQTTNPQMEGFGSSLGSYTISTSVKRSGDASFLFTDASVNNFHTFSWTNVTGRTYIVRTWVYLDLPSSGNTKKFLAINGGANNFASFIVDSTGKIFSAFDSGANTDTGVTVAASAWHCYEISGSHDTSSTGSATWKIDGNTVRAISGGTSSRVADQTRIGFVGGTAAQGWQANFDDIAVNDSTGSDQNSFPGAAGKIILVKPTGDSAIGTDWKLGTGTTPTGNAYDAVDNLPPLGVASGTAGSDSKQIRNSVSSTTTPASNADLTLQTYTAAGLPTGATVKVLNAFGVLSTNSASSTDMEISAVSNPTESSPPAQGVLGTAGTFPANWRRVLGGTIYNPSVTLGTAPVARVGKRTATTTAQLASFVGFQVEYEEALTTDMTGTAALAFDASASNMTGYAALSGQSDAAFGASGTISQGNLEGTAPINFGTTVVPPTGRAELVGSPTITILASGSGLQTNIPLVGSAALTFGATVVPPTGRAELHGSSGLAIDADADIAKALPPRVPTGFDARWASGLHVGDAAPHQRVEIRLGRFYRRQAPWSNVTRYDLSGVHIAGVEDIANDRPWQAFWTPLSAYIPVPNVRQVDLNKSASARGVGTATFTIDNILYQDEVGYRSIKRGALSPLRGYVGPGRTQLVDEQGQPVTEDATWYRLLSRAAQITVWQAYGDLEVKVFTGLIDDVDTTSRPDVITVVARDFGQVLTEERVFGWNKARWPVKDPVTFIDREAADNVSAVGSNPQASTEYGANYTAANVTDGDSDTYWVSQDHSTRAVTEWVEVEIPQGRYQDFNLVVPQTGMDAWVCLNAHNLKDGTPPLIDGSEATPGWLGSGSVPGANGGIPFIHTLTNVGASGNVRSMGGSEYVVGPGSVLRICFRNLLFFPAPLGSDTTPWVAQVTTLRGRRRKRQTDAVTQKWILVQDVSDVVKQILRWAGFKEAAVETSGISLQKKFVVNRGMFYMDVIDKMAEAVGFTFFMGDASADPDSIGVPTFRRSHVIQGATPVVTVTDQDLLTAIQVHQTDEPLSTIIRVRGRESSNGVILGGDASKRVMFVFRPPWAYQLDGTLDQIGGVLRHVIVPVKQFKTVDDCKLGCYMIALEEALESVKATFSIPGWPGVDLDDHVELLDLGTGVTTRVLVTDRQSSFSATKDKTTWTMSLGGAVVDIPDVLDMVTIINNYHRT